MTSCANGIFGVAKVTSIVKVKLGGRGAGELLEGR